jgi:hypothetical protein
MLWNVDKNKSAGAAEGLAKNTAANTQVTRKIAKCGSNSGVDPSNKIMGHALTIKEEYIRQQEEGDDSISSFNKLLEIC